MHFIVGVIVDDSFLYTHHVCIVDCTIKAWSFHTKIATQHDSFYAGQQHRIHKRISSTMTRWGCVQHTPSLCNQIYAGLYPLYKPSGFCPRTSTMYGKIADHTTTTRKSVIGLLCHAPPPQYPRCDDKSTTNQPPPNFLYTSHVNWLPDQVVIILLNKIVQYTKPLFVFYKYHDMLWRIIIFLLQMIQLHHADSIMMSLFEKAHLCAININCVGSPQYYRSPHNIPLCIPLSNRPPICHWLLKRSPFLSSYLFGKAR